MIIHRQNGSAMLGWEVMRELIKKGLRQRLEHGAAAALPFFEKAAQLDSTSHLPFFMLGNADSPLRVA
jgi:hypothetical protein